MTDEELAMAYINGDNKAFDTLLAHTQNKLFSYILFVVRDEDVANDIFQETFVKIISCMKRGQYMPTGKFHSWCLRIAHNMVMDWYRLRRSGKTTEASKDNDLTKLHPTYITDTNIEQQFVNQQILKDVQRLMQSLPPQQSEVVYMRFYQGLSFKEIADATNVSINTALGRMRYAVLNMRKMAREKNIQLQP